MRFIERRVRTSKETGQMNVTQCQAGGCTRSARFEAVLLETEHIKLCKRHRQEWEEAYDHALFGWPDEAPARDGDVAENREVVLA